MTEKRSYNMKEKLAYVLRIVTAPPIMALLMILLLKV